MSWPQQPTRHIFAQDRLLKIKMGTILTLKKGGIYPLVRRSPAIFEWGKFLQFHKSFSCRHILEHYLGMILQYFAMKIYYDYIFFFFSSQFAS